MPKEIIEKLTPEARAARQVEADLALRRGRVAYEEARLVIATAREEDENPREFSFKTSAVLGARIERVAKAAGDEVERFLVRAVLFEADRLEREMMVDRKDEGREKLEEFQRKKRKGREARR